MNADTFFEQFERLCDSSNGIEQLRETILQMAIRGRLSKAESGDDTVEDVEDRIQIDRKKKYESGLIRKEAKLPEINPEEHSFVVPSHWKWMQFGKLGDWGAGATPRRGEARYYGGSIIWLKSGELNNGIVSRSEETITETALEECSLRLNQPGDILVAMYGATIGKLAIAGEICTTNQAVCACTCFDGIYNRFLFLLLRSLRGHFIKNSAGAAQPNYSKEKIVRTSAPIPPFAEQARIVAKVDELMALCDELEVRQQERRAVHVRLNTAALDRLTTAETEQDFQSAWSRLHTHFDTLYTLPENVQALRQTILQLAVMGKLVPQDDGDVEELLTSIESERRLYFENEGDRRAKKVRVDRDDEFAKKFPPTWRTMPLGNIALFIDYRGKTPKKIASGVRLVTAKNVRPGKITRQPEEFISLVEYEKWMTRGLPRNGDVLFTTEAPLGNVAVVNEPERFALAQRVICFRLYGGIDPDFMVICLQSPIMQEILNASATGMTAKGIKAAKLKLIEVPLPPVDEQKRIVQRVHQLLGFCDRLEETLFDSTNLSNRLTQSMIESILSHAWTESSRAHFGPVVPITCDIINRRRDSRRPLGRTKLAKLQYMVQHQLGIDLGITFERHAHGPLWTGLFPLINTAKKAGWFTYEEPQRKGRTGTFFPGENIQPQLDVCRQILGDKQAAFDELLDLFDTLDTTEAELLTSLYAIHHDFQQAGHTPTDEEIIEDFYNWHEAKKKFNRKDVEAMLARMRERDLF